MVMKVFEWHKVEILDFPERFEVCDLKIGTNNQRTNGPVNAHLRTEIYTNKLV